MTNSNKVLYAKTLGEFLNKKVTKNQFANEMAKRSSECGFIPGDSEIRSWEENCEALKVLLTKANLPKDVVIAFEYQAPVGGRVDCMLFGMDINEKRNVVLMELKGWKDASLNYDGKLISTYTGGKMQDVLHPSIQVEQYHRQFTDFIELFNTGDFNLTSFAYCYNYESKKNNEVLFHENFKTICKCHPLYIKDNVEELAERLNKLLSCGQGMPIIKDLFLCQPFPTEKLMDAAANIMIDQDNFHLFGDQSVAYEKISSIVKNSLEENKKSVFVVKGGPGTGKTLIALKVMSAMARMQKSTLFATRSTALRDDLQRALNETAINGKNASNLIQDIYKFRPSQYYENQIDVLLVDEAHRVAQSANADKTGRYQVFVEHEGEGNPYCPLSQTLSLLYCAKVTIFFIDDNQAIKTTEIGQSEKIIEIASNYKMQIEKEITAFKNEHAKREKVNAEKIAKLNEKIYALSPETQTEERKKLEKTKNQKINELKWIEGLQNVNSTYKGDIQVESIVLKTQFRCSGGDKFVAWLDEVLYKKPNEIQIKLLKEDFNFHIFDNPQDLFNRIKELDNPKEHKTARLCAGWCWPWDDKQVDKETGDLKKEVVIGDFEMPWETKQRPIKEPYKNLYAPDTNSWMSHPMGVNQIGCIHTAQGFEFDYVGVILGPDIVYDKNGDCLKCVRENNIEGRRNMNAKNSEILIRNIYRVLMSRGKKGCFIFCCDPKVGEYFKRCMNQ